MYRTVLLALALLGLSNAPALAAAITVDQILYASGSDPSKLSGTVDMTLSGNTLTIILTNTSLDAAGSGAGILLTGIGFQLPTGIGIGTGSGAAINTGSSGVGFSGTGGTSVSQEWGYDSGTLKSGLFTATGSLGYNIVVSSMESQVTNQFAAGSIAQPPNLDGPDFGLVSALETGALGSGVEGIRDSIVITLVLTGSVPSNLLSSIESGNVGLSFGSPDSFYRRTQVPEPSSLLFLSGAVLAGVGYFRRRDA